MSIKLDVGGGHFLMLQVYLCVDRLTLAIL